MSARSGNRAQPIVYHGVVYSNTGDNDVLAVSVGSGQVLRGIQGEHRRIAGADVHEVRLRVESSSAAS